MDKLRVAGLFTYPIKSCAGTRLEQADITERGLEYDRYFMVAETDGTFISQRTEPSLAIVRPHVIKTASDGDFVMNVWAPGVGALHIEHDSQRQEARAVEASVHSKPVSGLEISAEANEWFSEYLSREVQLLATDNAFYRYVNARYHQDNAPNIVGFADSFPMLLTAAASLHRLNQTLRELDEQTIPMDRFRPNVVVAGQDLEAFDEDYWRRVQIGRALADIARPCKRCAIPYVDQGTGDPNGKAVGKALAKIRRGEDATKPGDKGVFFGQNLVHTYEPGLQIAEGQEVITHQRSPDRNVNLAVR